MPCVGAAPVFSVATSAAVIVYCHYLFSFFFWRVASERVAVRFLFLPALGTTDAKNVLGLGSPAALPPPGFWRRVVGGRPVACALAAHAAFFPTRRRVFFFHFPKTFPSLPSPALPCPHALWSTGPFGCALDAGSSAAPCKEKKRKLRPLHTADLRRFPRQCRTRGRDRQHQVDNIFCGVSLSLSLCAIALHRASTSFGSRGRAAKKEI